MAKLKDVHSFLEQGKEITCDELIFHSLMYVGIFLCATMKSSVGHIWFSMPRSLTKEELSSNSWRVLS